MYVHASLLKMIQVLYYSMKISKRRSMPVVTLEHYSEKICGTAGDGMIFPF